jgi:PKD repeat protein
VRASRLLWVFLTVLAVLVVPGSAVSDNIVCNSFDGWSSSVGITLYPDHFRFYTGSETYYTLPTMNDTGDFSFAASVYINRTGNQKGLLAFSVIDAANHEYQVVVNNEHLVFTGLEGYNYYATMALPGYTASDMVISRTGDTVTWAYEDYTHSITDSAFGDPIRVKLRTSPKVNPFPDVRAYAVDWWVGVPPSPPTTNFTASPTSGTDPLTVTFTDASTDTPTSWLWNFGDGFTSTAQNATHIYLYPGQYSVSLTAANDHGSDQIVKPYYITVTTSQVPPTAAFSADETSGTAPLTVSFTDESTGTPTSWSWEFGDGWGSSARNPTHSYVAPGTYTVTLTAHNSIGSDVETKTAYIVVGDTPQPADAILNGYTFDTTNNALLDGVTVTLESDTYSATNVSHSGGFYQFTGLTPGVYTVKGEKAGYLASPDYAVAVYSGAVVQKDIAVGASGVVVTGTVYDALTGETLNGAVVTGVQGSASYNYTSTGAGQYALNGLSKGVEITLNAALAGYTHTPITITPTSTSAYTAHLYLLPDTIAHNGTALAGLVTRSDTHEAIPNAQVILPGHANATTSQTGFYLFNDLTPGAYYVSATAAGYADSRDYAVNLTEGNLTLQDISLDRGTETATHMEYPPHLVRFLCIDEYNRPLQNVTIRAVYQESSSPIDWLAEWLGITPNVQITTETLEGTTGIDGSVVFLMVQSVQYQITTTAPDLGGMTKTFSIYPKEDEITIRFRTSTHPDLSTMPTYELTATETDDENILLALNYHDTTNATTSLTFTVTDHATGELIFSETFGSTNFPGWVNVTTGAENTKGAMYRFGFEATNTAHGTISQYKGITLKGDNLLVDLGFEDRTLYNWLAVILLFLFAGAFSGTNVKQGAILVPLFGGGLFWFIGWLPITIGGIISAIGFLGVLVYMRKSEWKVRA